jgi:lipoate-protein ligase A
MKWRLLRDGAHKGARNMAIDEALLHVHAHAKNSAPVLRFYGWNPACLSLGRFQRVAEVPSLNNEYSGAPFDWVRRPTGGRAVWHQHEITYCVVLREELLPQNAQSVVGAYEWLSGAFVGGLCALGVNAELAPLANASTGAGATRAPNCFENATRADFVANGKKIIGAAQMRRDGVVLQHGSILLSIDEIAWRAAGGAMKSAVALRDLGVQAAPDKVIDALCASFETSLGVHFHDAVLRDDEAAFASTREDEKYRTRAWNEEMRESLFTGESAPNSL